MGVAAGVVGVAAIGSVSAGVRVGVGAYGSGDGKTGVAVGRAVGVALVVGDTLGTGTGVAGSDALHRHPAATAKTVTRTATVTIARRLPIRESFIRSCLHVCPRLRADPPV